MTEDIAVGTEGRRTVRQADSEKNEEINHKWQRCSLQLSVRWVVTYGLDATEEKQCKVDSRPEGVPWSAGWRGD